MTRSEIIQEYRVSPAGVILSPGKFEGEPLWVPALWELGLEGFADEDTDGVFGCTLKMGDPLRVEFPELDAWLGRKRRVYLAEDDNGFVHAF